jgi:branched-subunit amino acid permease
MYKSDNSNYVLTGLGLMIETLVFLLASGEVEKETRQSEKWCIILNAVLILLLVGLFAFWPRKERRQR